MKDFTDFFQNLFSPDSWPARWFCGRWTPFHGWLYIISSLLIAAAYFSIPVLLFLLIKRSGNNLPFQKVFWLFLLFILACGLTHVADAAMFWYPIYRVSAILLFLTALISWAAVIGSYKVLPQALLLKSPVELERIIHSHTAELGKANEHLKKSNMELVKAQKISQTLMKQKDDFISIASHELKTPVTSLKVYGYLLGNEDGNSRSTKDMVSKMNVQIEKLGVLISEMLDSSKLQEGRLNYKMERIKINELVRTIVQERQSTTQSHKITLRENADVVVFADKERMAQIFENLITNAIKYSSQADEIIINIDADDNYFICSVQDFGIGIPADQQQKIFDRFYRVAGDNMNTYPGMGLGLYIVADIIEKHNGEIWVDSEPRKGSTFHFTIHR